MNQPEDAKPIRRYTPAATGIDLIRERFALDDLRPGVIAALRSRVFEQMAAGVGNGFDAQLALDSAA